MNYWADGDGDHNTADSHIQHSMPTWGDYAVSSTTISPGFGRSAALAGNTVVIGSPTGDLTSTDAGVVSVFGLRPSRVNTLRHFDERVVTGGDAVAGDMYGAVVHVTPVDDLIVVGAPAASVSQVCMYVCVCVCVCV